MSAVDTFSQARNQNQDWFDETKKPFTIEMYLPNGENLQNNNQTNL